MTIPGPGNVRVCVCVCVFFHKTWNDGLGPLFSKNIGPGFGLGLELGLGLGGFVRSLGWEARFPALKGRRFSDPGLDWPGNEAKREIRPKSMVLGLRILRAHLYI